MRRRLWRRWRPGAHARTARGAPARDPPAPLRRRTRRQQVLRHRPLGLLLRVALGREEHARAAPADQHVVGHVGGLQRRHRARRGGGKCRRAAALDDVSAHRVVSQPPDAHAVAARRQAGDGADGGALDGHGGVEVVRLGVGAGGEAEKDGCIMAAGGCDVGPGPPHRTGAAPPARCTPSPPRAPPPPASPRPPGSAGG